MRWMFLLGAVGCTGTQALPEFDVKAVQDELITNVEQVRQAEIALQAVDDFLPCADEASAKSSATRSARTWDGPACWARIGWAPDAAVRGGFWVEVNADKSDFTVHGVFDGDADGAWLNVTATKDDTAKVVSPDGVK